MLENHYPSVQSPKSIDGLLDNEIQESEQLFEQSLAADNDEDEEYLETSLISPKRKHPLKAKRKYVEISLITFVFSLFLNPWCSTTY